MKDTKGKGEGEKIERKALDWRCQFCLPCWRRGRGEEGGGVEAKTRVTEQGDRRHPGIQAARRQPALK